ncbi:flippase-like domain-containing protein, partial [bacterium]|nr:flippase-like domain-containing protein [candidate division CSSED10-310 bacterium]
MASTVAAGELRRIMLPRLRRGVLPLLVSVVLLVVITARLDGDALTSALRPARPGWMLLAAVAAAVLINGMGAVKLSIMTAACGCPLGARESLFVTLGGNP